MNNQTRDHGGGLDAAIEKFGGTRQDWIDLSTGINPVPYPISQIPDDSWAALPDAVAQSRLTDAARRFWRVPDNAGLLAAPGASSLIAAIPALRNASSVCITGPTYNEHAAAFSAHGWSISSDTAASARVIVHPNNPTGGFATLRDVSASLTVIDESFCDVAPDRSLMSDATQNGTLILKSFGKFWGLAGLRLGFAIGDPELVDMLADRLGPWPVSGPALHIGSEALSDTEWATQTRIRLNEDSARLDALVSRASGKTIGGTSLFRLYDVGDAKLFQDKLARQQIWSRIFPYSTEWIRLGLPHPDDWSRVEAALA